MPLLVTIFSAVQLEAKAIARAIQAPIPTPVLSVYSTFENLKLVHHLIGLRAAALPKLRLDPDTSYILLAGLSGALDPRLQIADLLLGDCPEPLAPKLEIPRALLHTAIDPISHPAQKAHLFSTTGAAAVDMETSAVRDFAANHKLPFIALRSISDTATQPLNPQLLKLIDVWGRAKWGEVASFVVGNPFRLFSLMRLGRDSSRATRRLGEGVVEVLKAIGGRTI